jgi:predicted lipid-binding transport protein (Tim44 family)|tara:strand:- start:910 stop:1173 length:264 start_codon:yes stop_codon:yes gene_type:complete
MLAKNQKQGDTKMDNVIKYITGFFGGLMGIMMAILPITILWYVLTGGTVFGMDVVANLTALVDSLGNGGFVGLVVLVIIAQFFVGKK